MEQKDYLMRQIEKSVLLLKKMLGIPITESEEFKKQFETLFTELYDVPIDDINVLLENPSDFPVLLHDKSIYHQFLIMIRASYYFHTQQKHEKAKNCFLIAQLLEKTPNFPFPLLQSNSEKEIFQMYEDVKNHYL